MKKQIRKLARVTAWMTFPGRYKRALLDVGKTVTVRVGG